MGLQENVANTVDGIKNQCVDVKRNKPPEADIFSVFATNCAVLWTRWNTERITLYREEQKDVTHVEDAQTHMTLEELVRGADDY